MPDTDERTPLREFTPPPRRRRSTPTGAATTAKPTRKSTTAQKAPARKRTTFTIKALRQDVSLLVAAVDAFALPMVFGWQHAVVKPEDIPAGGIPGGRPVIVDGVLVALMVPHPDRLAPEEQTILAMVIAKELWENRPLRQLAERAHGMLTHGDTLLALAMIAAPRMARRGMVDAAFAGMVVQVAADRLGGLLGDDSAGLDDAGADDAPDPLPVPPVGAHGSGGGHGEWEIDAGIPPSQSAAVLRRVADQGGRRDLPERDHGANGGEYVGSPPRPVGAGAPI